MADLYPWMAAAVLAVATWLAAMKLTLLERGRSAVEKQLTAGEKPRATAWIKANFDATIFSVSLFRTVTRLGFFALVLAEVVGLRTEAPLSWPDLLIAGAVTAPLLWVFTTVLAAALARHAAHGLIATGFPVVRGLTWLCYPLVKAVSFIDEVVRRLSGANPNDPDQHEAELLRSIEETQREGGLDEDAASMLENVVEFTSTDVAEIMTPRTDIDGIAITDDLGSIRSFITKVGHSRIPVFTDNLDHVLGILYVKDLVPFLGEHTNSFKLKPLLRRAFFVPETKPVRELLAEFQKSGVHMGIVIDEYGGTEGLVTIEDALEEIVGEIRDEHEPEGEEEPALVTIDDTHAEVDARFHIDDLNERLGLALPEDDDFDTVGGFVLATLGHVPNVGEVFESHDARFTALASAPTHVQRIGIELLTKPANGGNGQEKI